MAGKLEGKVGIVTGAAHGMGATHALTLAREGADVAAVDICRDNPDVSYAMGAEAELNNVVEEIKALGRRAIAVKCDVSSATEVENMVKRVVDEFGKIDILVNNAGVVRVNEIVNMGEEEWDLVMNVNLKGQFLCCKYVLPHMIAQKAGKIVNIGSTSGREPAAALVHYACSKAGTHIFTWGLSKEVAVHNINVNCVAPGPVMTPMNQYFLGSASAARGITFEEFAKAQREGMSTLGREVTTQDLANAMLFLVSEESRNITGYVIYVDGGYKGLVI